MNPTQTMPSEIDDVVLAALPRQRLLSTVQIQARASKRLTCAQVTDSLHRLRVAGAVVLRPPFDYGRPHRWGRA